MHIFLIMTLSLGAFSLTAADRPWKEIKQAIMKPSKNSFTESSFIIADFRFIIPPPGWKKDGNIPIQYFIAASLLDFQSSQNPNSSRVFDFFSGGKRLLDFYPASGRLQIKQKFEKYKVQAQAELKKYFPEKTPEVTDAQLLAYWLYAQDSDIHRSMQKFYNAFYIEPRNNFPIRSTVKEAKLILKLGLPFYVQGKNNEFICLGFFEKNDQISFVMVEPSELKESVSFSFFDKKSVIYDFAKFISWQPDWKIFYVPILQMSSDRALLLKDIKLNEEE